MKVKLNTKLISLNKTEITDPQTKKPTDLKFACVEALLASYQNEQSLEGAEKLKRWELAKKISVGGEVELTVEEIAIVKKLIGKAFGVAIVGPCYELLEGK